MSALATVPDGLLDGTEVARSVRADLRARLEGELAGVARPGLGVVMLASDSAARKYAESKVKACRDLGMACTVHDLAPLVATPRKMYARLSEIAADPAVHGVLVEHPLPPSVDPIELYAHIPQAKDVEGISYANMGRLMLGRPLMVASTAAAVMRILDHYEVPLAGRRAVVVGRSNIVGKPVAALLLARDATVVTCHSHTPDLGAETRRADVLVVSVGRPAVIDASHVREGAVVVDVGINFSGGRLVGDVDFEGVRRIAGAITPVPGGVGPVTTAMLLSNLVETAIAQRPGGRPPA
jgi:methylenetetrahydrofolate dehydrogenase (NADP+)/methenyltetrahydrofolate cyclohydrolase